MDLKHIFATTTCPKDIIKQLHDSGFGRNGEGQPFDGDFNNALEIDYIIKSYKCDSIVETGTFAGVTAEYFCRAYPDLSVYSCDIDNERLKFARNRLKKYKNVFLENKDSPWFIRKLFAGEKIVKPFFYLDAHWYKYWPIIDEINMIEKGVVCIHDFDVKNSNYKYDVYNNIVCDVELLSDEHYPVYVCASNSKQVFPGRAYFTIGLSDRFKDCDLFRELK